MMPDPHRPGDEDAAGAAVAEYLAGGFDEAQRDAFSGHLLDCEPCWREVQLVERGRHLAESARAMPPPALRERIRASVRAEVGDPQAKAAGGYGAPTGPGLAPVLGLPGSSSTGRGAALRRRVTSGRALAAAACLAVLLTGLTLTSGLRTAAEPPALAAAVADFRAQQLPGRQLPTTGAPDLSGMRLTAIGAAGGRYDDLAVDGYAYRDPAGRRLVVYLSKEPFPRAPGADPLEGADGPWTAERGGVVMLCARAPHALLVVGQDAQLVRGAAGELGVL